MPNGASFVCKNMIVLRGKACLQQIAIQTNKKTQLNSQVLSTYLICFPGNTPCRKLRSFWTSGLGLSTRRITFYWSDWKSTCSKPPWRRGRWMRHCIHILLNPEKDLDLDWMFFHGSEPSRWTRDCSELSRTRMEELEHWKVSETWHWWDHWRRMSLSCSMYLVYGVLRARGDPARASVVSRT